MTYFHVMDTAFNERKTHQRASSGKPRQPWMLWVPPTK